MRKWKCKGVIWDSVPLSLLHPLQLNTSLHLTLNFPLHSDPLPLPAELQEAGERLLRIRRCDPRGQPARSSCVLTSRPNMTVVLTCDPQVQLAASNGQSCTHDSHSISPKEGNSQATYKQNYLNKSVLRGMKANNLQASHFVLKTKIQ